MPKQYSVIILFFLTFSLAHAEESEGVKSIVDQPQDFTDRENLLVERMNTASLVGNAPLMLDYYRSLMQAFMAEDKQSSIISFSLDFLPKVLVYQNYTFAKGLLNHLDYRVKYFSRAPEETKQAWKKTIDWYQVLVELLQRDFPETYSLPDKLVLQITEEKKSNIDTLLQELSLALIEKTDGENENKFQHLYVALDTANTIHSTEFYYLISTILVKQYLKTKEYPSAVIRLNLLYQLFSNIKPSDYYRIKVLIYFTQVFLAKEDNKEAYTCFLRAKEMLLYNRIISNQEASRLRELIEQITPEITKNIPTEAFSSDFFSQFIIVGEN